MAMSVRWQRNASSQLLLQPLWRVSSYRTAATTRRTNALFAVARRRRSSCTISISDHTRHSSEHGRTTATTATITATTTTCGDGDCIADGIFSAALVILSAAIAVIAAPAQAEATIRVDEQPPPSQSLKQQQQQQQHNDNNESHNNRRHKTIDYSSIGCSTINMDRSERRNSNNCNHMLATSSYRQQHHHHYQNTTINTDELPNNDGHQNSTRKNSRRLHAPIGPWRMLQPNPYLQICYDTRTRNPIYVQYKLVVDGSGIGDGDDDDDNDPTDNDESSTNIRQQMIVPHHRVPRKPHKQKHNYHFYEETSMDESFRSRNSYYHNSGYDRGHLAPAADFHWNNNYPLSSNHQDTQPYSSDDDDDDDDNNNNHHHKASNQNHSRRTALKDTYNLCNISPQVPEMNRIVWNQLEQLVRQWAHHYYYTNQQHAVTYVTTGPIYLPSSQIKRSSSNANHNNDTTTTTTAYQYNMVGIGTPPSLIMVPTHFFKVIVVLDPTETSILHFACFVVPNDPSCIGTDTNTNDKRSIHSFIVPWTDLEMVTGLSLFPDLVNEEWKVQADQLTHHEIAMAVSSPKQLLDGKAQAQELSLFLTDGNRRSGSSSRRRGKPRAPHWLYNNEQPQQLLLLQHLCANQACIPRKQQQIQKQQQ